MTPQTGWFTRARETPALPTGSLAQQTWLDACHGKGNPRPADLSAHHGKANGCQADLKSSHGKGSGWRPLGPRPERPEEPQPRAEAEGRCPGAKRRPSCGLKGRQSPETCSPAPRSSTTTRKCCVASCATTRRRELTDETGRIRRELTAILHGHYGFDNEQLIQFGVRPQVRSRKESAVKVRNAAKQAVQAARSAAEAPKTA